MSSDRTKSEGVPSDASPIRETARLLGPFWLLALVGTVTGTASGLATAWLLATINGALRDPGGFSWRLPATLVGLGALSVGGSALAGALNSAIGQKLIAALRKDIVARILRAPIAVLEVERSHRLMATLTNDVDVVSAFTFNVSGYAIALAIVIGSFVYLATLSPLVFLVVLAALAVGIAVNALAKLGWIRHYENVRTAQDDLHRQYRAIIDGAKELRVNRPRRARVHMVLAEAADRIAALKTRAMGLFWVADAAGSAIFFTVIGLLLAARHWFDIDGTVISGAVIVLLFVKGPIERLSGALPILDQARIAFRRIVVLSATLERAGPGLSLDAPVAGDARIGRIEMRDVRYGFPALDGAAPFTLGPIDLVFRAGEIVFIVGENGSGKTTLIKLLLGLYEPQEGTLLLDGCPVIPAGLDDYRQLFTTIFSDDYLFDELVGGADDKAQPYLERLDLATKVSVRDGRFSTTDLSTGQRKRLALVHAYLERRPVIITDEWAADQDPEFRRTFYTELLTELRSHGRTLIVISHDDRYFHVADRVVRLANGRLVEDIDADIPRPA